MTFVSIVQSDSSPSGWRDEAPYLIEAEITSSWNGGQAGYLIGDDNDVDNYTATYRGALRPYHDTLGYRSLVVAPDGAWVCFGYFSSYTSFALDWTSHPDAGSTNHQTAKTNVTAANPNWDFVIEVEDASGTIIMRRIYSDGGIGQPDFGSNFGKHFYWNTNSKVLGADYGVGVVVRIYFFDDTPASLDWPPSSID